MASSEKEVCDAALEAMLTVAADDPGGKDGQLSEEGWAQIQHILDIAENPEQLSDDNSQGTSGKED